MVRCRIWLAAIGDGACLVAGRSRGAATRAGPRVRLHLDRGRARCRWTASPGDRCWSSTRPRCAASPTSTPRCSGCGTATATAGWSCWACPRTISAARSPARAAEIKTFCEVNFDGRLPADREGPRQGRGGPPAVRLAAPAARAAGRAALELPQVPDRTRRPGRGRVAVLGRARRAGDHGGGGAAAARLLTVAAVLDQQLQGLQTEPVAELGRAAPTRQTARSARWPTASVPRSPQAQGLRGTPGHAGQRLLAR